MRDGSRKVVTITEVSGMEGDVITMTDIFVLSRLGWKRQDRRPHTPHWITPEIHG